MTAATITALFAASLNAAAGLYAGWRWWRVEPDRGGWSWLRAAQVSSLLVALAGVLLLLGGHDLPDDLFWVYALVPVAINFFAEQFRVLSAQTVLDARGLEDAKAVGRLPESEQRSIVLQIARREMGVVALACAVNAPLALRAADAL